MKFGVFDSRCKRSDRVGESCWLLWCALSCRRKYVVAAAAVGVVIGSVRAEVGDVVDIAVAAVLRCGIVRSPFPSRPRAARSAFLLVMVCPEIWADRLINHRRSALTTRPLDRV